MKMMQKRLLTVVSFVLAFVLMGIATTATASAATVIGSIKLYVEKNDWEQTTDPKVTVKANGYVISGDVTWSEHVSECDPADYIYGTVTLATENGYAFKDNLKKSSISVVNGTVDSFSYTSDGNISVTLKYQVRGIAEEPYDLYWDGATAKWSSSSDKVNFTVKVCKNGSNGTVVAENISSKKCDLSTYIRGYYYDDYVTFKVKAVPKNKYSGVIKSSDYVESYDYYDGGTEYCPDDYWDDWYDRDEWPSYRPGWYENGWKYINNNWYYFQDGTYLHGQFYEIGNNAYGFRDDGTMITGWYHTSDGYWFFFQSDGAMLKNTWHWDGSNWYFLNSDGTMRTGWLKWKNDWYYLDLSSGAMYTGWHSVDGVWYWFDSNGVWAG